ncbi:5-formyltetrahydrofolate cyclo-ligase, partial [Eremomyces bilateralis CBS 781.70]
MPANEIVTTQILEHSFLDGKKVFVPCIYKRSKPEPGIPTSIMDMLELKSLDDFRALKPDNWGIPTIPKDSIPHRKNCFGVSGLSEEHPDEKADDAGLDLLVMPGMGFDLSFGRLGHGKGYYDYFLQRYAEHSQKGLVSKGMPFLAALSLNEQILGQDEQVPMGPTDWRVDALIQGDGTVLRAD